MKGDLRWRCVSQILCFFGAINLLLRPKASIYRLIARLLQIEGIFAFQSQTFSDKPPRRRRTTKACVQNKTLKSSTLQENPHKRKLISNVPTLISNEPRPIFVLVKKSLILRLTHTRVGIKTDEFYNFPAMNGIYPFPTCPYLMRYSSRQL